MPNGANGDGQASEAALGKLMDLFDLRVHELTICQLEPSAETRFDPCAHVTVFFGLGGEGLLMFQGREIPLSLGSVIVLPRNVVVAARGPIPAVAHLETGLMPGDDVVLPSHSSGRETDFALGWASVDATLGGVVDVFEHLWEPIVEDGSAVDLAPVLRVIESEAAGPKIGGLAIFAGLMKNILIEVFRGQLARESFRGWLWPAMMHPQLGRAAMAIMSRPQDPHTVESLAALAGISRSRFSELFTKAFDRSPIEFLQAVRLRTAQRLLINSRLPVKSVAAAVGYQSRSHFCRAFQAKYGDPPSAFRTRGEKKAFSSE